MDETTSEIVRAYEHIIRVQKGVLDTLRRSISETETTMQIVNNLRTLRSFGAAVQANELAANALQNSVSSARNTCLRLYKSSAKLPLKGLSEKEKEALECAAGGNFGFENEVSISIQSSAILVKTPLLWVRDLSQRSGKLKGPDDPERFQIFSHTVHQKMLESDLYEVVNLADFQEKTIQFLFVYNQKPNAKIFVLDNDNHLTKYVQDAVIILLPGGDSGLSATNYRSSIVTNAVPEGSYLVVSSGRNSPWPEDKIIAFWAAENTKNKGK